MDQNLTPLERAFHLAQSGKYASVSDIKKILKLEGYSSEQITGRELQRQLRAIINKAGSKP
jgi:hypothetical protein